MNKELSAGLAWAGGVGALTLGSVVASRLGYIDRETVERLVLGVNGLMIAWYGNRIPKTFVRNAQIRQVQRIAAWSQVLSGLAYAGLWAFAPIHEAIVGGVVAVVAGMAVTFGYCLSLPAKAKAG